MLMDFGNCNDFTTTVYSFGVMFKHFKFPVFGNNNIATFELPFSIFIYLIK